MKPDQAKIDFLTPATLKKWPSINKERIGAALGAGENQLAAAAIKQLARGDKNGHAWQVEWVQKEAGRPVDRRTGIGACFEISLTTPTSAVLPARYLVTAGNINAASMPNRASIGASSATRESIAPTRCRVNTTASESSSIGTMFTTIWIAFRPLTLMIEEGRPLGHFLLGRTDRQRLASQTPTEDPVGRDGCEKSSDGGQRQYGTMSKPEGHQRKQCVRGSHR
jgi:hypothetical protein